MAYILFIFSKVHNLTFTSMTRTLLITVLALVSTVVFGQDKVKNDASYSRNNYKHPNKAAYAAKHNLDNSTVITFSTDSRNEDYKHGFSKKTQKSKASVESPALKSRKTYKHPYGI